MGSWVSVSRPLLLWAAAWIGSAAAAGCCPRRAAVGDERDDARASAQALEATVRRAAEGLDGLRATIGVSLIVHTTDPATGNVTTSRVVTRSHLDRAELDAIGPLFADLRAGAPIECDAARLRCEVSSESSAIIGYELRQGEERLVLVAIEAPSFE